jgi:hypothetical protein
MPLLSGRRTSPINRLVSLSSFSTLRNPGSRRTANVFRTDRTASAAP